MLQLKKLLKQYEITFVAVPGDSTCIKLYGQQQFISQSQTVSHAAHESARESGHVLLGRQLMLITDCFITVKVANY